MADNEQIIAYAKKLHLQLQEAESKFMRLKPAYQAKREAYLAKELSKEQFDKIQTQAKAIRDRYQALGAKKEELVQNYPWTAPAFYGHDISAPTEPSPTDYYQDQVQTTAPITPTEDPVAPSSSAPAPLPVSDESEQWNYHDEAEEPYLPTHSADPSSISDKPDWIKTALASFITNIIAGITVIVPTFVIGIGLLVLLAFLPGPASIVGGLIVLTVVALIGALLPAFVLTKLVPMLTSYHLRFRRALSIVLMTSLLNQWLGIALSTLGSLLGFIIAVGGGAYLIRLSATSEKDIKPPRLILYWVGTIIFIIVLAFFLSSNATTAKSSESISNKELVTASFLTTQKAFKVTEGKGDLKKFQEEIEKQATQAIEKKHPDWEVKMTPIDKDAESKAKSAKFDPTKAPCASEDNVFLYTMLPVNGLGLAMATKDKAYVSGYDNGDPVLKALIIDCKDGFAKGTQTDITKLALQVEKEIEG